MDEDSAEADYNMFQITGYFLDNNLNIWMYSTSNNGQETQVAEGENISAGQMVYAYYHQSGGKGWT